MSSRQLQSIELQCMHRMQRRHVQFFLEQLQLFTLLSWKLCRALRPIRVRSVHSGQVRTQLEFKRLSVLLSGNIFVQRKCIELLELLCWPVGVFTRPSFMLPVSCGFLQLISKRFSLQFLSARNVRTICRNVHLLSMQQWELPSTKRVYILFPMQPSTFAAGTKASSCLPCSIGKVASDASRSQCSSCSHGFYASASGLTTCVACPVGVYTVSDSSSFCTSAAAFGRFVGSTGAFSFVRCATGTYSLGSASSCTSYPAGKYASSTGQSSCTSFEPGSNQPFAQSSTCQICTAGKVATTYGSLGCENCKPGFVPDAFNVSCLACVRGKYSSVSSDPCQTCPSGTISKSKWSSALRRVCCWNVRRHECNSMH